MNRFATPKRPPERYRGCDDNGRPLDPDHLWNRNLQPEQKARRLQEIEDYCDERMRREKLAEQQSAEKLEDRYRKLVATLEAAEEAGAETFIIIKV